MTDATETWMDADLGDVDEELLALVDTEVQRELASRSALNDRLSSTIAIAGVLLGAAFALSREAARVELGGFACWMFGMLYVGGVVLLVCVVLLALWPLRPEGRPVLTTELLRYWALERVRPPAARADRYKHDVELIEELGAGNTKRARGLLRAQRVLGAALVLAAAGALTLFLSQ